MSFSASPRELFTGDLDGDARTDLLEQVDGSVLVHYFDKTGALESTLEVPSPTDNDEAPAVGELTGDGIDDLAVPFAGGVVFMLGNQGRALVPTAHPSLTAKGVDQLVLAPAQVIPSTIETENVVLGTIGGFSGLAIVPKSGQTDVLAIMPGNPDQLAGPMAMANFDDRPSSPCDEAVLSYRDDKPLLGPPLVLFPLCTQDSSGNPVPNHVQALTAVDLGGAHMELGAKALDVDHDGHLDLVMGVLRSGAHEIDVAYGVGDGTFSSTPPGGSTTPGDNRVATYGPVKNGPPLAIAWLDGDPVLDYVTSTEVRASRGGALGSSLVGVSTSPLSEAWVLDMNADGRVDVIAAEDSSVEFYGGTGDGRFAETRIPIGFPVSHLAPGDFDGDNVMDLALAESLPPASDGTVEESLAVLWGKPYATPAAPVSMGRLDPVQQIAVVLIGDVTVDPISDIAAISKLADGSIVLFGFGGRTDRALRSPFLMSRPNSGAQIAPTLDVFYSSRLMLGEETGDTHLDLVEAGHPDPSQAALGLRLGMTPCTGEAHLASGSVAFSDPLSSAARWDTAIHATIDLDADGRDEVVTLTTSSSDPTQGVALVSHVLQGAPGDGGAADAGASGDGGSEPAWQISDPVSLGLEFNRIEAMGRPPGETRGAVARKADLDGDGYPDLVALGTENGQNVVAVFFNDRGGTLGAPVVVRAPSGASADSFALVQADSDPEKELLLLAGGAAYLTDCKGRERTFSVAPSPVVTRAGASLVACGDFDGDGIEDVALGGGGKIELFAGKPSLR